MVMNAVKDVAAALGELINATKLASGKPIHDPAMNDLKESAKVGFQIIFVFFFCDGYKHSTYTYLLIFYPIHNYTQPLPIINLLFVLLL